ncbi:hypothetical protein FSP39_017639 [Pinctada imbricata]|uniref:Cytochrome P450 n=1 Tax=Pinctada imbricata TaxID=66713 RepID=A0AA88XW48_PINIB|nr:hypothetical protein FSP39_017639 [Pinctada imbricata]
MDVIASTAFGVNVDSNNNPDDPFVKNAEKFISVTLTSPVFMILFFLPFLIKPLGRMFGLSVMDWENQIFFRDVVVREINKRTTQRTDYVDFLQLMMEAHQDVDITGDTKQRKISLTTSEIIANSLIFFFAGYETTATALSLLAYRVALNQEIQDRIFQEIDEKLQGEKPNYDNVQELEYLDMCINETLRMYPPAARFDRTCTHDTEICGIPIQKGLNVFVPVYAIHHCSDYWKDPEEFDPERFSPENKRTINPLHFLPFGYGPRNCLGMRLALLEIKIAFARIIQDLKFSAGKNTKVRYLCRFVFLYELCIPILSLIILQIFCMNCLSNFYTIHVILLNCA